MNYRIIDQETYYRKGVYRHFTEDCKCSTSMTARLDVTDLAAYSKRTNTRFYLNFLYLLSKVLIEKNARSIAMAKILGYSDREISSIYNRVTTAVVFVSLIICLPIGYAAFAGVFRIMMMFFTGWLTYYIAPSV